MEAGETMGSRLWETGAMAVLSLSLVVTWLESCLCRTIEIMELLVQNENKQDENAAERPEKSVVRVTPRSSQISKCRSIDGVCTFKISFSQKCALRTLIQLSRFLS